MRSIGNLPGETVAKTFSDVLLSEGIDHQLEREGEVWAVWIRSEDDFNRASERLAAYRRDPANPEFVLRAREGAVRRRLTEDDSSTPEPNDAPSALQRVFPHGVGALTVLLAGICMAIAGATWAGYGDRVFDELLITHITPEGKGIRWDPRLPEIFAQGEFWRLLTPALVHFSVPHLILNLLWLIDLSSAVEKREGTGRLGLLFVTIGIGSNLAQTWLVGPAFWGVSGVLFGLLGYIWMKSKLQPELGLALHPYTVVLMLVFFSLGLGGAFVALFGVSMANGAHAAGLILGIAWGLLTSLPALARRRKGNPD